jgi:hypothetical protein
MKRSYLHTDHEKQNNKNKVNEHNNKLNNNPKNTRVVSLDVMPVPSSKKACNSRPPSPDEHSGAANQDHLPRRLPMIHPFLGRRIVGSQIDEVDWQSFREMALLYGAAAASTSGFLLTCLHDKWESTWRPCTMAADDRDVASGDGCSRPMEKVGRFWCQRDIERHCAGTELDGDAVTGMEIKPRGKSWI